MNEHRDLSASTALEQAAKALCKYCGILWSNTFPDMGEYPVWEHENDAQREMRVRDAAVLVYAYLHYRCNLDPTLEAERLLLLSEINPKWRTVLPQALGIAASDLEPRATRRAYGHDPLDTETALPLFAAEQRMSAGLLLEGFRREELRRLNEKAWRMKNGVWDERAKEADDRWRRRNAETFGAAEARLALADEATASHGPPAEAEAGR